jgi:hypothetical protein
MCWWLFCSGVPTSVAAAHIYREDMSRVTTFHNRLCLSLLKRIIYSRSISIKTYYTCTRSKTKQQNEVVGLRGFGPDFDGLFTRTSCACARAHRIASSHHVRRGEQVHVCVFYFSSSLHTYKYIDSILSYK